jgi:hypothetical protein
MGVRVFTKSRFAMIAISLWLCGAGPAWAGGGGEDAGSVQAVVNEFCQFLGMTSCPQLPTVTQAVLEIAGLQNTSPDYARGPLILGICSVAGNSFLAPGAQPTSTPCDNVALNAVNRATPATIGVADLANLTPLAFTLNKQGHAVPTQLSDPSAVAFFYAVATQASGQPDTLALFYDYPPLTSASFAKNQVVAKISLPLQVLSATNGSERVVCGLNGCPASLATLSISATCSGGTACLGASVIGDFSVPGTLNSPSPGAAQLGLQWSVSFGPSPNSKLTHAIFQVNVPLLVTGPSNSAQCGKAISAGTLDSSDCGNDPAYFGVTPAGATNGSAVGSVTGINQITGLPTAFSTNDLGFTPAFLGLPVGIAPSAVPTTCVGASCPVPLISTYPFCASFLVKGAFTPATAAFYSIGTDGTTNLSAPLVPSAGLACPF